MEIKIDDKKIKKENIWDELDCLTQEKFKTLKKELVEDFNEIIKGHIKQAEKIDIITLKNTKLGTNRIIFASDFEELMKQFKEDTRKF